VYDPMCPAGHPLDWLLRATYGNEGGLPVPAGGLQYARGMYKYPPVYKIVAIWEKECIITFTYDYLCVL